MRWRARWCGNCTKADHSHSGWRPLQRHTAALPSQASFTATVTSVPPSSLIFAVIVAVWAAYVIQHWVHRREHVATARSVDRFSEAMRVLERRQRRPQVDLSEPTPRSYSVSLMRPSVPDVVVKRAQPSAPMSHAPAAPLVAEMSTSARSGSTVPRRAIKPRVNATRMRGIALLSAVMIFVTSVAVASTGLLTWWAVPIAAGVGVFTVAMVRRSVHQASGLRAVAVRSIRPQKAAQLPVARRSRRSKASAGGSAAAAFASNLHGEQFTSSPLAQTPQPAPTLPAAPVVAPAAAIVDSAPASVPVSMSSGVYDIEAVEQVAAALSAGDVNAAPVVAQPLEPGTWAPVPVPPPRYTLKAKAQPRPVRDELLTELPQDGIALSLEEEFEELPVAIRGLA